MSFIDGIPNLPDFPNTNFYDGELGWLIKHVRNLIGEYANLLARVEALEEQYDTIPEKIQEAVDAAMVQIRAEMDEYFNKVNAILDSINKTQEEIQSQLLDLYNMVMSINKLIAQTLETAKAYADYKDALLEIKIKKYIDELSKEWPHVICPVDGRLESVETALEHVYSACNLGVHVQDLINWNVTVQDLINMPVSVEELIMRGYIKFWIVFEMQRYYWMYSPITGKYEDVRDVVRELARFHEHGPYISEIIVKGVEVQELIDNNVDCYNLAFSRDWFNALEVAP